MTKSTVTISGQNLAVLKSSPHGKSVAQFCEGEPAFILVHSLALRQMWIHSSSGVEFMEHLVDCLGYRQLPSGTLGPDLQFGCPTETPRGAACAFFFNGSVVRTVTTPIVYWLRDGLHLVCTHNGKSMILE